MAQVHDNGMVAHIWAHQSQGGARSHNGNFWFDGNTINSYCTPIAKLHMSMAGRMVALITSETFSHTTSGKHMPAIWRALDYGRYIPAFRVPSIGASGGMSSSGYAADHTANLTHLVGAYTDLVTHFKWTRGPLQVVSCIERLQEAAKEARDYAILFDLAAPALDPEADKAAIDAHHAAREAKRNTPQEIAKRERARVRKAKREAEAARLAFERGAVKRQEWLDGANSYWRGTTPEGGALLRVKGDTLETSMGASVPLDHAVRAFRFVKLCRDKGTEWQCNGHTLRVGHFQVDSIAANGDFHAGCHFIQWAECERIARQLDLDALLPSDSALEPSSHAA